MYVLLGDSVISDRDVVGVFDMDATTVSVRTRDFLKKAQDGGRVVNTSYELPKAFVVTKEKVYITNSLQIFHLRMLSGKNGQNHHLTT